MIVKNWLVKTLYQSLLERHNVAKNMSVDIFNLYSPGFTGGRPDITPLHERYENYISLQEFILRRKE